MNSLRCTDGFPLKRCVNLCGNCFECPASKLIQLFYREKESLFHRDIQFREAEARTAGFLEPLPHSLGCAPGCPRTRGDFACDLCAHFARICERGADLQAHGCAIPLKKAPAERQLPHCLHIAPFERFLIRNILLPLLLLFLQHNHIAPIVLLIIALGLAAPVKEIQKMLSIRRFDSKSLCALARIEIQILPPDGYDTCRIARTLHAPFYFQAVNAALREQREQIQAAEILTAEEQPLSG